MRFIIGCSLSMIFSASCAHALAPAEEDGSEAKVRAERTAVAEVDYGKLVRAAIEREQGRAPIFEEAASEQENATAEDEMTSEEEVKDRPVRTAEMNPRMQEIADALAAVDEIEKAIAEAQKDGESDKVVMEIDLPDVIGM